MASTDEQVQVPGTPATSRPAAPPPPSHAPVKLARPDVSLDDRYRLEQGTIFLTGIQALVRAMLDQHRADRRAGLRTGVFVSGYQGSPLGSLDKELGRLGDLAADHDLVFTPGLNEELAATAVYGSQLAPAIPGARVEGVTGWWYGKNPGLDRAMDALRHAQFAGTSPSGGAVALVGDDPSCKSSTLPSAAEATLAALHAPTFSPGTLQEVLDLARHAVACSRASGLWSAVKVVTNVADAAGTAQVWPDRVLPVLPEVPGPDGRPWRHRPDGSLLAPMSLELERSLREQRIPAALAYGRLNGLNPVTVPTRDAWLGVVASGRTYYELVQALHDCGLDVAELERRGIRLMRVGMVWPHDREAFRAFARGLEEVLVVEEKDALLEGALRDALYDVADRPRVVGREDEAGRALVSPLSDLDADAIALVLARRLERLAHPGVAARAAAIEARRVAAPRALPLLARTPAFCSGCPHSTSTANPDGTLVGAGIGCHTMVLLRPDGRGEITGITQMGGEGAQFAGIQPFTDGRHVVQNVGDGTLHHSASLAIRFAVASGIDVTYKVLRNQTVAMTGGQDVVGGLSLRALCEELLLEGVAAIAVTTEDVARVRREGGVPDGVRLVPRERLGEVQAELAATRGVTVLVHDQGCAAEARRLRKRGKAAAPAQRAHINQRVCEGCGDCGVQSGCLSVHPVETEFGRKTEIHQASCNQDLSCFAGDCPSFLEVVPDPDRRPGRKPVPELPVALPEPARRVRRDAFCVRMPGVGGTGVVTVSQVLQMAAMLDGLHCWSLDQTGLAQKGGPVLSDVRISRRRPEGSNKAGAGSADLLLGLDVLHAASPKVLSACDPQRTFAVVSTTAVPTASMVTDTAVRFPAEARTLAAIDGATRAADRVALDAGGLAEALFGDHLPANTLLLGAAYQAGLLPVSDAAIERAIELNGAAVERTLAAFRWGRAVVAHPDVVAAAVAPAPEPVREPDALTRELAAPFAGELRRLVEVRVPELVAHTGERLARAYAAEVARVLEAERAAAGAGAATPVAEAFARSYFKLLAVKDEYEVARLHLLETERARLAAEFGEGAGVRVLLHPPALRALGLRRKLKVRAGVARPLFRTLRAGRRLRGTALDPFRFAEVRRVERELPGEYVALVDRALAKLTPASHATVAAIADLPDLVRGYEDVKLRNVARFREEAARLERRLDGGAFTLPVVGG